MISLNIEQPSATCVNLKEANEIPVKVSTTELNCANLESMPCIINPKRQTSENTSHLVAVNQNEDTKPYECKECHKNFTTVAYLQEHMKSHTKLFTCWICEETFSSMTQLTSHLTNCVKQQKSMHCITCDKTFEFPALFKQHKHIHHPEGRPREAFQNKQLLVQNIQQYIGRSYSRESSEIFKSMGPDTHTMKHTNDKRCCPICQKEFSNSYYALQGHVLMHEVSNFFCIVCHKEFTTSKIDFKIHMQQHVPENQPPFKCEHCSKEYGKRNRLWSHYRVAHPLKRVNVTTETDSRVAMVKKTLAENNILSESETPICNMEISEIIKETHSKRFTCPECQKACTSKHALLEHLPLHEIRYFICVVCHKEFTITKIDFKIHMQQHCTPDNRGRFNCEHCPRSYSHKRGLIGHYRVKHPPKRVIIEKEGSENCEQTQQIALVKSEPNESDSTITHNEILINKTSEDDQDNILLELARYEKFCDKNELTELVSSMESEQSSPVCPYINLEDDKITVEEPDVNTEAIAHNEIIIKGNNNLIELEKSASYKEFDEENKLTELVSSMESEPSSPESSYVILEDDKFIIEETDVKTDAITHNENIIKKTPEDNNLLELEKQKFCEENKLTELVSSMKSEPSSPESPYFNLEHDKCIIEETNVKTQESKAEFNNPSPALIGINLKPQTSENTPHLVAVNQNKDTKTYGCKECHKNFTTVAYLQEHMIYHTKLYTCWICDETFSLMTQLTSHLTDCSKLQKSMHCTTCDKTFEFPALFKQHKLIYHPEGRPREAFQKKHPNIQQYIGKVYFDTHTTKPIRCCPICQKEFSNSYYALREHALLHAVSNFFCVVCHKEFRTSKIDFKIHMQQHVPKNQPPFKCEHCSKEYGKRSRLWSHYRVVHPLKKVNVTTETDSSVAMVKKTVAENNILSESDTPICNMEISGLINETHAKKLTCPECQKACQSKYSLLEHLQLHEIRDFICVVCHKKITTTKIDFKIHMKQHCTHDNRGRFNCEHCLRSYTHKKALISHYRVKHPPKRVVNEKEGSEDCEQTQRIALVKSEPNESDFTITHNEIIINKISEDDEDNNLLELEKAARHENELTELVSSIKSELSSPESPYINLEDDKITVEEINANTEAITHNEIIIKEDNNLTELEKSANHQKENELTEPVSLMKSELSSPESSYVKLEDDKFVIEETDVKTDVIMHNEIIIKEDNNLLELEKAAPNEKYCEENELTEFVSSKKTELSRPESLYVNLEDDKITVEETDVKTETIAHSEILIKKTLEDNNLLELEKAAHNEKFYEGNELTELVSSMKSVPSSPETPYINLEDNKFIIEGTNVKTEESKAELNNPLPALIGSCPAMVKNNDPCPVDVDQNQQKKFYMCHECNEIDINASYLHQHFMQKHVYLLCWICGERFLKEDKLAVHIGTHVRMYTCKLCDKSFVHQSDFEIHNNRTHRTQNCLQWHDKLFSCKICGKRFITERHLENHLKTHTEDESTEVAANETESSIGTVTRRKIERRKRKTVKKCEVVTLPGPLDLDVPVNDENFCKQSELSELMDFNEQSELCELITSEPASLKSGKSSQRPSSLDLLILPESDTIDLNVPINDKDSEQSELSELKDSITSNSSSPNSSSSSLNSYESSWGNNSQSASFGLLKLPESDPFNQNIPELPKNDKEREKPELNELVTRKNDSAKRGPFSSESYTSSQKTHSPSSFDGNILLKLSRVHSFTEIAKKAVLNGKLVKVKNAVVEQKNHNITNHKPDNKGPFKCKHCPKYFALKTSLTRHCRTDHLPKRGVTNETEVVTGKKLLVKLKLLKNSKPQKQHVPESNTENRGDTVSYKEFCEQSELNEIVDAELVDTAKYEPSSPESPYYMKSELEELLDTAKMEKYYAAKSPYYYVITECKDLVDTATFDLSSLESSYYVKLEEKLTIDENEENTEELNAEILNGPSTSK